MNALTSIAPALAETRPAVESQPLAGSLLNFVAMAMADPNTNIEKLESLLRIQREIVADDARLQFNRAMSQAQGEMQPVVRDATNSQTNSKYARLETIDVAIRPIYTRHGFLLSFNSEPIEGPNERIVCEVSHTAGHTKRYQLEAGLDTAGARGNANKTPLHGLASTVSYLRRYLTTMVFNVVLANEDNDGNRSLPTASSDGRLSPREVEHLELLMRQTQTLEGKFLERMLPGLRSITQAPASDFPRLKNALRLKASILEQRATAARAAAARQAPNGDGR